MTDPRIARGNSQDGLPTFIHKAAVVTAIVSVAAVAFLLLIYAPSAIILTFAAVWFGCVLYHAGRAVAGWTRLPESWGTGLVLAGIIVGAVAFAALLGLQVATQINDLVEDLSDAASDIQRQLQNYPQLKRFTEYSRSTEQVVKVVGGQSGSSVAALLMTPFGLLVNTLFIFFTGIYLAFSARMYRDGFVALFPTHHRPRLAQVCSEAGVALWRWTLVRLFSMALVGTAAGIGLWLIGVPMAATLGVATALFTFIPNVGPVLATIPPMLLAIGTGPWTPLYVLLLYVGIELVESYLITPILHEQEDELPAAVTIVAQLLLGLLFGILGVTFAMPIALVAMIFIKRLYVERGLEGTGELQTIGTPM